MPTGTIKKLVEGRGFGFIDAEKGPDVFFHHSAVSHSRFDDLAVGQQIEYTLAEDGDKGKGPRAASVKPVA